ncbi:hypothetical protein PhCBS80983_g03453 [Powellomyces hirtus]|uniref:RNB domain-containing protein n=1 Tax=Powellomyces hirtus TaxID=109895 RepID=A0A507E1K5_9FUNG|nr:hypothetical protein PhCBS80983_g03453 [Powellomyces hirtus]
MPDLKPGDFVEVRRGTQVFHGVLASVPEFTTFDQDHRTILYNGHYILHQASHVTYQIAGWALSSIVSKPISSGFATAALSVDCAQLLSEANIPMHSIAHVEKFREAVDTYAFAQREKFLRVYRFFSHTKKVKSVTVDEVAKWVFYGDDGSGWAKPTPAEHFATYQYLLKQSNCFEACKATRMRHERKFFLRPPEEVEDINWSWDQVRAAGARGQSRIDADELQLQTFIGKVRGLIEAHRENHGGLPSETSVRFTPREHVFIRSIKAAAYHSTVFPNPHRQIAVNGILKALYPLYGNRPGQTEALQMLKEIGILAPWENISMYKASESYKVPTLEGHGMSSWAEDVAEQSLAMGRQLLAGGEFTFREDGVLDVAEPGTAGGNPEIRQDVADLVKQMVVSPTGPLEESFYQRDPCAEIRRDFGQLPVYVIDDPSAHELDDGMSVEDTPEGLWVHVHIADPTAYIPPSHPLSLTAQLRANSIYLPERHYPMMPDFLSNERFNLGKSQCAITFSARVGEDGEFVDIDVKPSIVRNVKIIHYDDVDEILDWSKIYGVKQKPSDRSPWIHEILEAKNAKPGVKGHSALGLDANGVKALRLLQKTMLNATAARIRNGGCIPDQLATRISVNPYPQPFTPATNPPTPYYPAKETWPSISLKAETSGHLSPAHMMVSECMIMAGRVAAKWCIDRDVPAIYRGQPYMIDSAKSQNRNFEEAIKALDAARAAQDPETGVIPFVPFSKLLPYMPSAVVDMKPIGHFSMGIPAPSETTATPGMALSSMTGYVKVTSPLRRYKDMIVHWNMKAHMLATHNKTKVVYPFESDAVRQVATPLRSMEKSTSLLNNRTERHWATEWIRRREILARTGRLASPSDIDMPYVDFRDIVNDNIEVSNAIKGDGIIYDALVTRVSDRVTWVILTQLGGIAAKIQPAFGTLSQSVACKDLEEGSMIRVAIERVDVARGVVDVRLM